MKAHLLQHTSSPLNSLIIEFIISRQAGGCSPRTVQYYQDELRWFREYLHSCGVQDIPDITAHHIRQFLLYMATRRHRNSGGIHCAYRVCKTLLRWYEAEYEPRDWQNPIRKVKPPKLRQEPLDPISLATIKALLATCGKRILGARDRAIILALLDTGCRAGEFVSLNVGDIDLSSGAVIIRHGKGGKPRVAFLGGKSRREIIRYLRLRGRVTDNDPLWVNEDNERLTYSALRCMIKRRAIDARVKPPSLHGFRRTFALMSLRAGMDVYSLQKLMGHSDLSVLSRYLAQNQDDLQEAHRKAGPVDKWL